MSMWVWSEAGFKEHGNMNQQEFVQCRFMHGKNLNKAQWRVLSYNYNTFRNDKHFIIFVRHLNVSDTVKRH